MIRGRKEQAKYLKWFWSIFISFFIFIIIFFILIAKGYLGYMPTFKELENPQSYIASQVYSEDNNLLGTYYIQNRTFVEFKDLSPYLVNALIATEDVRFTKHSGVDIRGLARVFVRTILLGNSNSGGGSTITQQLAKNLFPRDTVRFESTFTRNIKLTISKFKEWITSIKLERNYTKEEILVMYLNTVPFGSQAFGIKSASQTFFNIEPDSINIEQAALLIGMLKAPTRFSPVKNPKLSLIRRNVVLNQMQKYGYISYQQFDSVARLPIELDYKVLGHQVGLATYLREYLRNILTAEKPERSDYITYKSYKEDSIDWETNSLYGWCNKNNKPDGTPYNLYRDGLKIFTTVNSVMQKYAEDAMKQHMKNTLQPAFFNEQKGNYSTPFSPDLTPEQINSIMSQAMRRSDRYIELKMNGASNDKIYKIFNHPTEMTVFSWNGDKDTIMSPLDSIRYYKKYFRASLMSMDPSSGLVKAYIGGPDFKYFKYDMVTVGKRQVGSTIKPFLYTLAMQEGFTPCHKVPNVPITFIVGDSTWTPKNSGRNSMLGRMVTLEWGLANSINYISAWLIKQFNPQSVADIIHKMGVKSFIDPVPSIFLGTSEISLYEMVGAYNTFANKGVYVTPIFVTRIEDKNGNVLATFVPQKTESINEETAYLMVHLLEGVVNRGTAGRLRYDYHFTNEIGGKTGTTQNHSDGWFIGITPELVTGVWVGAEDRGIHFMAGEYGQGSRMAMPIWAFYMQKIYNDKSLKFSKKDFDKPKDFNIDLNCTNDDEEIQTPSYKDYQEEIFE